MAFSSRNAALDNIEGSKAWKSTDIDGPECLKTNEKN